MKFIKPIVGISKIIDGYDGVVCGFNGVLSKGENINVEALQALQKIAQRGLLTENGIAVYERDRPFEGEIAGLEKYDERKYGKTYLTFFRKGE